MMCKEATETMTDASEGALSGWRKASYRFHLAICPFCRAHRRQVEKAIETVKAHTHTVTKPQTHPEARERALEAFRRKHSV
jgi:predicted anti-sigma-YlaC factor YlaD